MSWKERFLDFFGIRRSIAGLLVMVVLVGMGERMAERFLPLYQQTGRRAFLARTAGFAAGLRASPWFPNAFATVRAAHGGGAASRNA